MWRFSVGYCVKRVASSRHTLYNVLRYLQLYKLSYRTIGVALKYEFFVQYNVTFQITDNIKALLTNGGAKLV